MAKVRDVPFIPGTTSLRSILTEREDEARKRLDARYMLHTQKLAHTDKSLVYFLGDNPKTFGNSWSAISKKIPTYRMNTGLYWIPSLDRWMTSKERLASMGWPVTAECATAMGTPLIGAVDPQQAGSLCGNAMHFQTAAIMQLIALGCFGPVEPKENDSDMNDANVDWPIEF